MSTYLNCYEILSDIRREINEYSTAYMEATDTSGAYSNAYLVRKINTAQSFIHSLILNKKPEVFLTAIEITGVGSVYALPFDFGRLLVFKDENDRKLYPINIDMLKVSGTTGNKRFYYRKGSDLILDRDGITDTYTLWYYKRCRDLDQGQASAADTLATTAKAIADYYNGMILEDITGTQYAEVTDYSAARVITSTITLADESYYGIVSELPEEFHFLISKRAVMNLKASSPIATEKLVKSEYDLFYEEFRETFRAYAGSKEDITQEEIWLDLGSSTPHGSGIIMSED